MGWVVEWVVGLVVKYVMGWGRVGCEMGRRVGRGVGGGWFLSYSALIIQLSWTHHNEKSFKNNSIHCMLRNER